MDLPALMDKVTETPVRQRLVEVMSCMEPGSLKDTKVELRKFDDGVYNFFAERGSWWAEHKVSRVDSCRLGELPSGNGPGRSAPSYSLNISARQTRWPS